MKTTITPEPTPEKTETPEPKMPKKIEPLFPYEVKLSQGFITICGPRSELIIIEKRISTAEARARIITLEEKCITTEFKPPENTLIKIYSPSKQSCAYFVVKKKELNQTWTGKIPVIIQKSLLEAIASADYPEHFCWGKLYLTIQNNANFSIDFPATMICGEIFGVGIIYSKYSQTIKPGETKKIELLADLLPSRCPKKLPEPLVIELFTEKAFFIGVKIEKVKYTVSEN